MVENVLWNPNNIRLHQNAADGERGEARLAAHIRLILDGIDYPADVRALPESALSRLAYGALIRAAQEMAEQGSFGFAADAVGFAELETVFKSAAEQ